MVFLLEFIKFINNIRINMFIMLPLQKHHNWTKKDSEGLPWCFSQVFKIFLLQVLYILSLDCLCYCYWKGVFSLIVSFNWILLLYIYIPGLERSSRVGYGNPLQYSCLENSMDRGAWWATVYGATKSYMWLSTHKVY